MGRWQRAGPGATRTPWGGRGAAVGQGAPVEPEVGEPVLHQQHHVADGEEEGGDLQRLRPTRVGQDPQVRALALLRPSYPPATP